MRRGSPRSRRGFALLEALVALTLVALAAATLSSVAMTASRSVDRASDAEREMQRASGYLAAITLWPADDLDRRLGERRHGPWRVTIGREISQVYTIELRDSTGTRLLLRTATYRRGIGYDSP